jgi:hypothetical protein
MAAPIVAKNTISHTPHPAPRRLIIFLLANSGAGLTIRAHGSEAPQALPLSRKIGDSMRALRNRIAERASSIDPFVAIIFFSGFGLLICLLFGFDLALSALFS